MPESLEEKRENAMIETIEHIQEIFGKFIRAAPARRCRSNERHASIGVARSPPIGRRSSLGGHPKQIR
jgi:hypothetical protein